MHFVGAKGARRGRHINVILIGILRHRRKNSDNCVHFVVHLKRLADDSGIGAEIVFPVFVAEKQDRRSAELVVVRQKGSSEERLDAKQVKIIGGDDACAHALGIAVPEKREGHGMVFHKPRQGAVLRAIVFNLLHRKRHVRDAQLRFLLADENQLLPLRIGQRAKKHGVHHAEDRGIGSDSQSERQNSHRSESRIFPHHAKGVTAVTRQDLPVLPRGGGKDSGDRFLPELERSEQTAAFFRFTVLLAKDAFHFAFIVRPEIEREHANKRSKQLLGKRQGLFCHGGDSSLGQFWFSEKFLGARLTERFFHALRFGDGHIAPEFCKQVVAAPFIVEHHFRAPVGFGYESCALEPRQISIERSCAEPHLILGAARHFFQDGVSVLFAISQRQEDVKHRRRERQERLGFSLFCHVFTLWLLSEPGEPSLSADRILYRDTL